jgi:hypothetical protein
MPKGRQPKPTGGSAAEKPPTGTPRTGSAAGRPKTGVSKPKGSARKRPQDVVIEMPSNMPFNAARILSTKLKDAYLGYNFVLPKVLARELGLTTETVRDLIAVAEQQIKEQTGTQCNLTRLVFERGSRAPNAFILQLEGRLPKEVTEIRRRAIRLFKSLAGTPTAEKMSSIAPALGVDPTTARSVVKQYENQTGIILNIKGKYPEKRRRLKP